MYFTMDHFLMVLNNFYLTVNFVFFLDEFSPNGWWRKSLGRFCSTVCAQTRMREHSSGKAKSIRIRGVPRNFFKGGLDPQKPKFSNTFVIFWCLISFLDINNIVQFYNFKNNEKRVCLSLQAPPTPTPEYATDSNRLTLRRFYEFNFQALCHITIRSEKQHDFKHIIIYQYNIFAL
jgi:hypothetical protein